MNHDLTKLATQVRLIAEQAGQAILEYFADKDFEEFSKSDESPVTSADFAANDVVINALQKLTPSIPIMSEETEGLLLNDRVDWSEYWLVDPLDGTQEFVAGRPDFAVNIALIKDNKPILGVIHAPVTGEFYWAAQGCGAYKIKKDEQKPLKANVIDPVKSELMVAISRVQKLETITKHIKPGISLQFISLGSCALKSCLVAEGKADIYIRVGPTGEWDTGAPQIIVEEAGGLIIDSEFEPLSYNKRESFMNPNFFVGADKNVDWASIIIPYGSRRD